MLIRLIQFFRGYLKITLYGYSPERFLNLCGLSNIFIWGLEHHEGHYELYITVSGFKRLRPILRKTQTRVKITGRFGLRFILHRYRKRKVFFAGSLFCILFLYFLSLFVWDIQMDGNDRRTTGELLSYLESVSVYHGVRKKKIDCESIETMLRTRFKDVIWASAELKGTRLIIHIQESLNEKNPGAIDNTKPMDLCTEKDGMIKEIITRKGTPLVVPGSVVSAGAVLVRGRLDIPDDNGEIASYQYCVADADILMKTAYHYSDTISSEYTQKEYTGKEKKEFNFTIFSKKINVRGLKVSYPEYETKKTQKQLKLWANFYLPFYFGRVVHKEYKTVPKKYTQKEMQILAQKKLESYCEKLSKKRIEILQNNVKIEYNASECHAEGSIDVIEKTGTQVPTVIESPDSQEENNEHNGDEP